ncbi:hypothetical protein B0A54_17526 [Friedmanniomyces endolithicus]|uniref:Uncharacterized protein n=1 Tax=Friedmanniomyces endolithicus TaxID=329885 RepID=A0A4U0TW04_9PEZI|nr:hypothetical protein B0A54_17526 [Friedmanniomyces endolithicus]
MPVRCTIPNLAPKNGPGDFDIAWARVFGSRIGGQFSQRRAEARAKLISSSSTHGKKRKVHAEVQILLFYELHPQPRPPRIICASKSACYLCNLFFHVHGKFEVPGTHGRIYDTWTLPDWSSQQRADGRTMLDVLNRFNQSIENTIRKVVGQGTPKPSLPNESTLYIHPLWASVSTVRPEAPPDSGIMAIMSLPLSNDSVESVSPYNPLKLIVETASDRAAPNALSFVSTGTTEQSITDDSTMDVVVLPLGANLQKHIKYGTQLCVETSTIHFEFSVLEGLDDQAKHDASYSFPITIAYRADDSNASKGAVEGQVVDFDALRIDQDTVISLENLPASTLLCSSRGQDVVLTFGVPRRGSL